MISGALAICLPYSPTSQPKAAVVRSPCSMLPHLRALQARLLCPACRLRQWQPHAPWLRSPPYTNTLSAHTLQPSSPASRPLPRNRLLPAPGRPPPVAASICTPASPGVPPAILAYRRQPNLSLARPPADQHPAAARTRGRRRASLAAAAAALHGP